MFRITWIRELDGRTIASSDFTFVPRIGERVEFGGLITLTIKDVLYKLNQGTLPTIEVTILLV